MANEVDYSPCQYRGNSSTREFSYDWKLMEVEELIVSLELVSTGDETILELGSDYTVLNEAVGGNVTLTTAPSEDYYINIRRKTSQYQEKGYSTSTGFQGDEIEKSFDKVSCNLQDMQHGIDTFEEDFSEEIHGDIAELETNVATQISEFEGEVNEEIDDFKDEVNTKIQRVTEAVEKLNRLDEVLAECEGYSAHSEEQSIISQQNAVLAEGYASESEQTLTQIQSEHTEIISEMTTIKTETLSEVTALKNQSVAEVTSTKETAKAEIQALGIFMRDDRLFYIDSQGVTHEFRNDYGGIAPMAIPHKDIMKVNEGFALSWADPEDSVYENNVYCTWGETVIVRKVGSYPESPFDGEVVLTNTVRNQYAQTPYIDEVDNTVDYKYRAFPRSINKVYSYDDNNKFGQWIYSYTRLKTESVPSKKILYRGTNEHYRNAYMNFSSNTFNYGDWENAPFLSEERLLPCTVYNSDSPNAGQISQILDRNDYKKQKNGETSEVTDTSKPVNAFMRFKLLYRWVRKDANGNTLVDISNEKVNDNYKPYGGFVKPDGTLREYIYLPIYRGSLISNKVRSMSGNQTPMSGQTAPNERTYCKNNGSGHDMITWTDRQLIEDLSILMFKTTDFQSALGQGKSNGGSSVSDCLKSGTMDTKGLFWGSTSTAEGIKLFGMENRYASQWERILGMILVNGQWKVKLSQGTSDGSTVSDYNFTGEGYITLDAPAPSGTSGGYISESRTIDHIGTVPIVYSGSSSTYECDGGWYNNSGTRVPIVGGNTYDGALCGLFCFHVGNGASGANWNIGSSVSFKPL